MKKIILSSIFAVNLILCADTLKKIDYVEKPFISNLPINIGDVGKNGKLIVYTGKNGNKYYYETLINNYGIIIKTFTNFDTKLGKDFELITTSKTDLDKTEYLLFIQSNKKLLKTNNLDDFINDLLKIPDNEIVDFFDTCSSSLREGFEESTMNKIKVVFFKKKIKINEQIICTCES